MSDDNLQLLAEFRSDVPRADDETLRRIRARAVAPKRSVIRRRRPVLAIAFASLLLVAGAVAAVEEGAWWESGTPAVDPEAVASVASDNMPANVVTSEARTVVTDGDAALIAVPLGKTGYCLIPALDGKGALGAQCDYQVNDAQSGVGDRTVSATRRGTASEPARWIVYGRITDPRAAKLDLGAFSLSLATGGFFLKNIEPADWPALSGTAGRARILDSAGRVVRRGCVSWGVSPSAAGAGGEYSQSLWQEDASGAPCTVQTLPIRPTVDLAHAKKLFDVTLTANYSIWKSGETVTFEAAPASDGTTCFVVNGPHMPADGFGASNCIGTSRPAAGSGKLPPINAGIGAQLAHEGHDAFYVWNISGWVDPAVGIAKLELQSDDTVTPVSFGGGFFFAQLPTTTPGPVKGTGPLPAKTLAVVGYDASGTELARVDLAELYRRSTPH